MSKISERATASIKPLPENERPLSEHFRVIAKQWVDADSAFYLLSETKKETFAAVKSRIIAQSGTMTEAAAERKARCDHEWNDHIKKIAKAREDANLLRMQLEYIKMKHREWIGKNADARHEARLST